jgi:excisionase family DNA binding protein
MQTPNKPRPHRSDSLDMPLLVSVPEAARLLGVGKTFAWTLVHSGSVPTVRLGKRVLVPRAALERLADLRAREPIEE